MKKNLSSSRISHSSISSAISRDSKDKKNKNISLDLKETKKTIGDQSSERIIDGNLSNTVFSKQENQIKQNNIQGYNSYKNNVGEVLQNSENLINKFNRSNTIKKVDSLIPDAMPLITRITHQNTKEPDLFQKLRRETAILNPKMLDFDQDDLYCEHEKTVENWKCTSCNSLISKFNLFFDNNQGKVNCFTKIVYENSFLQDFKYDFRSQNEGFKNKQIIIYQCYQASNMLELKEYIFMLLCKKIQKQNKIAKAQGKKFSPFGSGIYQNLSGKLQKYLIQHEERQKKLQKQCGDQILMFDSLFESGNLLQAEKNGNLENTYNLYMQVDTNTRGHQQWFYFRVRGGKKGQEYTFNIMNFTKPGVTGGKGYKMGEYDMRIMVRSKKNQLQTGEFDKWEDLTNTTNQCEYVKTNVQRRKKDVIAAGADSDQEEWVEEAFNQQPGFKNDRNEIPLISLNGPETNQNLKVVVNQEGVPVKKTEKQKGRKVFYYYALRFKYTFEHDNDSVYFSFSEPITYTDILQDLHNKEQSLIPKSQINILKNQKIMKEKRSIDHQDEKNNNKQNLFQNEIVINNQEKNIYYKRTQLCKTVLGFPLYQIIIAKDLKSLQKNNIVLITSRVHSGESPGSQVFRGIYDILTSSSSYAKYLRKFYTFILIPCMNPDGVAVGNYRNSLAGVDLNRQWINPEPEFHSEVYGVKNMIQQIKDEEKRKIWIFCDLHGHSKKKNSFFYGCNTAANGGFLSWTIVRLLPRIIAQKTHMFNYKDCRFRVEPYKIGTARIVAWKQFQITHSFTLETSFYGYDIGEEQSKIFSQEDYKNIGQKFVLSIYDMHSLWKQIKRELQITHGWLKPKTLIEMTGVPAAQILAQETALQKEEERKKKAIQQYEEFLKTYYNNNKPAFKSKQEQKLKVEENTVNNNNQQKGQKSQNSLTPKIIEYKEVNKTENNDVQKQYIENQIMVENLDKIENDQEYMFKMHQGLVKIQAIIRGFIDRQRVKKMVQVKQNRIINKQIYQQNSRSINEGLKRQRSNQIIGNSSRKKIKMSRLNPPSQQNLNRGNGTNKGFDTSSEGAVAGVTATGTTQINNHDSSNDEQLIRSNTDQQLANNYQDSQTSKSIDTGNILGSLSMFGSRKGGLFGSNSAKMKLNWRDFFDGDELDKAYQIVEVEQRDESDSENSEKSMGSDSNPSEDNLDEEEVYKNVFGVQNPQDKIEQKKLLEQQFFEKVQKEQFISQQDLIKQLKNDNMKTDQNQQQLLNLQLQNNNQNSINLLNVNITAQSGDNTKLSYGKNQNHQRLSDQKGDDSISPSPYSNFKEVDAFSNHPFVQKNFNGASIKLSPINTNELEQENIFQDNNQIGRRLIKSSNQNRGSNMQQNHQQNNNLSNQHSKLVQQTYKIQQNFQIKKQNMNQVIKDCFIIKRMGSKTNHKVDAKGQTTQKIKNILNHQNMNQGMTTVSFQKNNLNQQAFQSVSPSKLNAKSNKRYLSQNKMIKKQMNNDFNNTNTVFNQLQQTYNQAIIQGRMSIQQAQFLQNQQDQMLQEQIHQQIQTSNHKNLKLFQKESQINLNMIGYKNRQQNMNYNQSSAYLQNDLINNNQRTQGAFNTRTNILNQPNINQNNDNGQVKELIAQMDSYMKNMNYAQQVQFIKMVQDKNIKIQIKENTSSILQNYQSQNQLQVQRPLNIPKSQETQSYLTHYQPLHFNQTQHIDNDTDIQAKIQRLKEQNIFLNQNNQKLIIGNNFNEKIQYSSQSHYNQHKANQRIKMQQNQND